MSAQVCFTKNKIDVSIKTNRQEVYLRKLQNSCGCCVCFVYKRNINYRNKLVTNEGEIVNRFIDHLGIWKEMIREKYWQIIGICLTDR